VNTSGDDVKPSTHAAHISVGPAHINELVADEEPLPCSTDLGEAVILSLVLYYVWVS